MFIWSSYISKNKKKRKSPREVIIIPEEETPKVIYCRECGAEILDITRN